MPRYDRSDTAVNREATWEQQSGEPNSWYQRFLVYLRLGGRRNVDAAYREEVGTIDDKSKRAGSQWHKTAKDWHWKTRAEAYDLAQAAQATAKIEACRSQQVDRYIAAEASFMERELRLREMALQWEEDYLAGRVIKTTTTEKEKDDPINGVIRETGTSTAPQAPPQWILERRLGRRDYDRQFNILIDLLKQIMGMEGPLDEAKGLIQATLEGLLLESGVDEVRSLLSRSTGFSGK